MIKIVADSACDVPEDMAEKLGITIVPVFINVGDQSYVDGIEMSRKMFYDQLSSFPQHPSTAAPPAGTFTEIYNQLAQEGATQIISVHIADALSNTYNAARVGAEAADVPVTLVDTDQVTVAAGLLVILAAEAAQNGRSHDEIVSLLNKNIPNTRFFGMINNLDALRRSGRVNWAQFGFGTLLQIKPIMMIADGAIEVVARVRTQKKAIPHVQELMKGLAPFERVVIVHTDSLPLAERLHAKVVEMFPGQDIPIMEVGPAVGTHIGAGAVGFASVSKR
ncbi:MAG: DegV family protein [Chloroflexota bacterium]